ncbi:hypothetical protein C923_03064 [Plasmodium falciparum UGT5.1]|uniref:Merozoite TRAP-like protein n=1 Tax=Plasmodium falciparum UGT5.1 TaxID=1237627 RepID=W7JMS2_PLAFA|nr:hypothetical protein C923_03064 [Plasmodium falciparum UGT5.1]
MKKTILNLYLINILFALSDVKGISTHDTCDEWSEWSACTHGISTRKCLSDSSIKDETLVCTKCDKWGEWSECKDGRMHRKVLNCPFIKEEQECDVNNEMAEDTHMNNSYIYFNADDGDNEYEDHDDKNDDDKNYDNENDDDKNDDDKNDDDKNDDDKNDDEENYNDTEEKVKNNDIHNSSANSNNEVTNFIQIKDKIMIKHKTTNIHPVNFIQEKYTRNNKYRSDNFSKILNNMNHINNNNYNSRSSSTSSKNARGYRGGSSNMYPHVPNYTSSSVHNSTNNERKSDEDLDNIEGDNITKEERIVPINNKNYDNHDEHSNIHEHDTSRNVDNEKYNSNDDLPNLSTYDYDMNNDSYKKNHMKKPMDSIKEEQTKQENNQNNEKVSSSEKQNDDISALYEHMNTKDQEHTQHEQPNDSAHGHFEDYSKLYIASGVATLVLLGGSITFYFLRKEKTEKVVQEETKEENFEVMFNDDALKGKDNKAMDEEEFWALE